MNDKIKLGISACLLGQKVRYDGGHKLDSFLANTLNRFVEFVPICPEVEAGFPIPREPFRLKGNPEAPRLVTVKGGLDMTARIQSWAEKRLEDPDIQGLGGFIFKSDSPASGLERVKVYDLHGVPAKKGVGIFARAFKDRFPLLPVEDEGRLHDIQLRENFVERIFAYQRFRRLLDSGPDMAALIDFHSRHKLLLMAHHPQMARQLGKQVANASRLAIAELLITYLELFMKILGQKATVKKNTNVLLHMAGYFKKELSSEDKSELLQTIEEYRLGYIPLIVPLTLIKHTVRKFNQPYLKQQVYLNPHPLELKLRNHA